MEDKSDERQPWEQQLRNVNSGSLLWLVARWLWCATGAADKVMSARVCVQLRMGSCVLRCMRPIDSKSIGLAVIVPQVVHMEPKMHSMSGAKYGKWFVEHHIRVQAKYFNSGRCPPALLVPH